MPIKSMVLEPSKDNVLESITNDTVGRNKFLWNFVRLCDAVEGGMSIAIDADWGEGKTFFVNQAKMLMECYNPCFKGIDLDKVIKLKNQYSAACGNYGMSTDLGPSICVYYDAWLNDSDADPILSLVYSIIKDSLQNYKFENRMDLVKLGADVVSIITGKDFSKLLEEFGKKDVLTVIEEQKEIHEMVESFLSELLTTPEQRLVIFIDELDRCKPSYAILLLERIKHYFTNDRITYVFSVNTRQLQYTIKQYYGNDFDACRYLDRFFDLRIALPPADTVLLYRENGIDYDSNFIDHLYKRVADYCGFGMRETLRYIHLIKLGLNRTIKDYSMSGFPDQVGFKFASSVFSPISIGLMMKSPDVYKDFVSGKDPSPLIEIVGDDRYARFFCSCLLNNEESFESNENTQMVQVKIEDKLKQVYDAAFAREDNNDWREITIGKCEFDRKIKDTVLQINSLLSDFANYD